MQRPRRNDASSRAVADVLKYSALAALAAAVVPIGARADVVIGNFENAPDGFVDWNDWARQPIDTSGGKWAYVTGAGVTNGTTALQLTQSGFHQTLGIELQQ